MMAFKFLLSGFLMSVKIIYCILFHGWMIVKGRFGLRSDNPNIQNNASQMSTLLVQHYNQGC